MKNQKENEIYIRPATLGDICVLLEPAQKVEIDRLRQRQMSLQTSFGGAPIERIHLTCQRFACQDEQQLKNLQKHMPGMLAGLQPFSLTALSLRTLYVPIRQTNILKWEIDVTDELRQFVAVLEQALVSVGIKPLYRTGFVSSLLAALKEVPALDEIRLANYGGFPFYTAPSWYNIKCLAQSPKHMLKVKRSFRLITAILLIGSMAFYLGIDTPATGLIHAVPVTEPGPIGSGVYIGQNLVLTNWHVQRSYGQRSFAFQRPVELYGIRIDQQDTEMSEVVYAAQEIDLAIIKLKPSIWSWLDKSPPCLYTESLKVGEQLRVESHPMGQYPAVEANLEINDPIPQKRLDPDPRISAAERYAAMTITAVQPTENAYTLAPGSSGGPAFNNEGAVVGLIWTSGDWTEADLSDGWAEAWITPASAWTLYLKDNAENYSEIRLVLETICENQVH